eukprot:4047810-Prymnesium_polylepis.2
MVTGVVREEVVCVATAWNLSSGTALGKPSISRAVTMKLTVPSTKALRGAAAVVSTLTVHCAATALARSTTYTFKLAFAGRKPRSLRSSAFTVTVAA